MTTFFAFPLLSVLFPIMGSVATFPANYAFLFSIFFELLLAVSSSGKFL